MNPAIPNGQIGSEIGKARGVNWPIETPYFEATLLLASLASNIVTANGIENLAHESAMMGMPKLSSGLFLNNSPVPAIVMNENIVIQITACCQRGITNTPVGSSTTLITGGFPLSRRPIMPNFSRCEFISSKHSLSDFPSIPFTLQEYSPDSTSPRTKYLDEMTWIKSLLLQVSVSISSLSGSDSEAVTANARGGMILPLASGVLTSTCS